MQLKCLEPTAVETRPRFSHHSSTGNKAGDARRAKHGRFVGLQNRSMSFDMVLTLMNAILQFICNHMMRRRERGEAER